MDAVTPENVYHNKSSTPNISFCLWANETMSAGTFLGDNPLDHPFPLLLYQIIIIFIATRLVHGVLSRLSLPLVISQIVAGLLLGSSFLSQNKAFESPFFKPQGWKQLKTLGYLSFTLFNFVIGVKTDVSMVSKSGKEAFSVAIFGITFPYVFFGIFSRLNKNDLLIPFDKNINLYTVALRWSLTSYLFLSCALGELNLLTSKLGRLAMSASLIVVFFNTFLSILLQAYLIDQKGKDGFQNAIFSFLTSIGISIAIFLVAKFFVVRHVRQGLESRFLEEARFITILMIALACGLATDRRVSHFGCIYVRTRTSGGSSLTGDNGGALGPISDGNLFAGFCCTCWHKNGLVYVLNGP